jgi:hypothetical protein
MKLNQKAFANASAVFMGIVYLLCGFSIMFFPGLAMEVSRSWFHGIDLAQVWSAQSFPGNFLLGLVSAIALSWLGGWLFAWLYNKLAK